jgi:hypothetical protein
MAHLWRTSGAGGWEPVGLDGHAFVLDGAASLRQWAASDAAPVDASATLVRRAGGLAGETWALLARPEAGIAVNGTPVDLGVVVLADRDAIGWPFAPPLFFSTERLASVAPYPPGGRGFCPRCKDPIESGAAAVRCPGCGVWHHEFEGRLCWTHIDQCASCPQVTALDAGFRWTPEEL